MSKKSKTKSQVFKRGKFINRLFISAGTLFVLFSLWFLYLHYLQDDITKSRMVKEFANKELPSEQICMYGDEIQVKPTISFLIGDETFYACCERCRRKIINNFHGSQFSSDPFSHEQIKKSSAIIAMDKYNGGRVNYFKSIDNFKQFNNLNKSSK